MPQRPVLTPAEEAEELIESMDLPGYGTQRNYKTTLKGSRYLT